LKWLNGYLHSTTLPIQQTTELIPALSHTSRKLPHWETTLNNGNIPRVAVLLTGLSPLVLCTYNTLYTMAPKASVQEASPSPPPLPPGPLPTASTSSTGATEAQAGDVPIESLGNDDEDDEDEEEESGGGPSGVDKDESGDEEWDPSEERLPGQSTKGKGKGKETEQDANKQPWQAVWAAEQNGKLTCPCELHQLTSQRGTSGTRKQAR
jgi:hypothetical protein